MGLEQSLFGGVRDVNLCAVSTVQQTKAAIDALSPAERAELERLLGESHPPLDPEVDSPELEAELLKAVNGTHSPLREGELREIADKVVRERRTRRKP